MINFTNVVFPAPFLPTRTIINDTGAAGGGKSVSLRQLFAARSDYRFRYIAPNAKIPEIDKQQARRTDLELKIRQWYAEIDSALCSHLEGTSEHLLETIQNDGLMAAIKAEYPGIKQTADEYLTQEAIDQAKMFERFGIPKGSIQNLYNNADVLESTKSTVSNAIRVNIDTAEV